MTSKRIVSPAALAAGLFLATFALALFNLGRLMPPGRWLETLASADLDLAQTIVMHSFLPRAATSLISGAALGLAGLLLQQVLRNPLASPTTLGVSAGAGLALASATLFAPELTALGRDAVAGFGALAAVAVVLALGRATRFAPTSVVLAGLIVGLYAASLTAILTLLNQRYLDGLFIWGAGSLVMQDWSVPAALAPRALVAAAVAILLIRPLAVLELDEVGARSLGLPVPAIRLAALSLAAVLTAIVTSAVGVISFVGLIAPTLARLAGARRVVETMVWSPVLGAAVLALTDQTVQALSGPSGDLAPTGAATAVVGAPLMLWLLLRMKRGTPEAAAARAPAAATAPGLVLIGLAVLLLASLALALFVGRTVDGGWALQAGDELSAVMPWRAPRAGAAAAAGAMLAVAGAILQRVTANPMASPEVLGVGAGAGLGLFAALMIFAAPSETARMAAASAGAFATLVAVLAFGGLRRFEPDRALLAGVAIAALVGAITDAATASGDPRAMQMLAWMSGSTYAVDATTALVTGVAACALVAVTTLSRRPLDLLPLGDVAASAVGLSAPRARMWQMVIASGLTAAATLIVGPLSFVGLMGPHLVRLAGLRGAGREVLGAALVGAAVMVLADWTGRTIVFPWQIPAGLTAAIIGAPVVLWLLRRN